MEHLTTLEFHVGVNEHGWAVVEGEAGENAVEQLQGAVAGQEQVILAQDESGAEQPLFAGIIRTASLITYGEYTRFRIELQSGTIQMDRVKRSRSFQDVKETYSQIAQKVASEYPDGAVIPTVGLDNPLGVPVIQYRETDWEFMKRMASWCGGVVVPETHYSYPRLWFGFPERAFTCTFPEDCYTTGISQRYYELGGPVAGYERSDFLYYDVCSSQSCDLGWYTVYKGQEFLIYEKWGKMERGELIFTYRLGKPGLGWGRKRYNDKISGMTILGEVLSTERETVRLKLDIDEGWNPGGPYPYTWRPETGNMMYCMPQVGTRVSLYFPNYDEQMAMAVNCVRTNGGSCTRMSDPSKRSFVTEHGKEMNLYPQEMSLLGGANGMVKLEDETGISISTDKKITVVALGPVSISGKVAVTTALMGEVVMAKGNILTGEMKTTQVQSNQYDLLAADFTRIEGWNQQTFEAYDDAPQEGSFDWGGLIGNVLAGLAVVGAVALTLATFGAAAPVIIGAVAVGTTAVIGQAMSDYTSGAVSSVETYMITGFMGAVAGAVSGGVGAMVEGAIPAGATALAKMGIVGGSGVLETLIENTIMGQETTGTDMVFAFVASAGLFGIGDNLIPILNQTKCGGQALGSMLDEAGRSIDNALNSVDNVLSSAARQAGNTLDSISKELYETLDDIFRKLEDVFPPPNRPRYAYAMAGGPAEFIENIDEPLNTVADRAQPMYAVSGTGTQGGTQPATQGMLDDAKLPEQMKQSGGGVGSSRDVGGSETRADSTPTNSNRYCLSGEEHYEAYKEMFGTENVEWTSRDTLCSADRLRIRDWAYPPTDELYLKYKNVYQNDLYYNQATGDTHWPVNDGFAEYPETITLQPGTIIDRYGSDYGTFTSPLGVPYANRALAPGTEMKPYSVFEVVKPIEVQAGKIAPWFDQPGGGVQYMLPDLVDTLLDPSVGVLRRLQ